MNRAGCERKFRVSDYIARFGRSITSEGR